MNATDRTNLVIGLSNLALQIQEGLDNPWVILKKLDAIRQRVSALDRYQLKGSAISTDDMPRWYGRQGKQMITTHLFRGRPCRIIQDRTGLLNTSWPEGKYYLVQFEDGHTAVAALVELQPRQTAETSRVPEEERPNLRSQLLDELARQRRLLKKNENPVDEVFTKPVEMVFRKPIESTTQLKQLINANRLLTITEWVDSLTENQRDQLAYDLGCWWETRRLWQRMFILWVYVPFYGLSDWWTGAECPRLVVTMWERGIQNSFLLEQGPAIRKWLNNNSEAEQSSLNKEVSDWWKHLRLDQQAGAYRLHWNRMGA